MFTMHKNWGGNCAILQNLNTTVKKWVLLTNSPKKCAIIDSELKKDGDLMTNNVKINNKNRAALIQAPPDEGRTVKKRLHSIAPIGQKENWNEN